jgi:hypothetical protein
VGRESRGRGWKGHGRGGLEETYRFCTAHCLHKKTESKWVGKVEGTFEQGFFTQEKKAERRKVDAYGKYISIG